MRLLEDKDPNELILKNEVAQIVAFDPVGRKQTPSIFPNSLMGVFSVIRQTFLSRVFKCSAIPKCHLDL